MLGWKFDTKGIRTRYEDLQEVVPEGIVWYSASAKRFTVEVSEAFPRCQRLQMWWPLGANEPMSHKSRIIKEKELDINVGIDTKRSITYH